MYTIKNRACSQKATNNWLRIEPPTRTKSKSDSPTLDMFFVIYELDLQKDDFNSISISVGEEIALQRAEKLIMRHLRTNTRMMDEFEQNNLSYIEGIISDTERMEKNHDLFLRYGVSSWEDDIRSWASPEEMTSIGVVRLEGFLRNLPHKRLLDYALNMSEKMFLPASKEKSDE